MTNSTVQTPETDNSRTSLIEYPCQFPIKVMGENVDHFVHTLTELALAHDPRFDVSSIELRPSKNNRYLGVTLIINAINREQLDALYKDLTSHPMVKMVF
jgi:putative lipoic acid-binding regulatory protein